MLNSNLSSIDMLAVKVKFTVIYVLVIYIPPSGTLKFFFIYLIQRITNL